MIYVKNNTFAVIDALVVDGTIRAKDQCCKTCRAWMSCGDGEFGECTATYPSNVTVKNMMTSWDSGTKCQFYEEATDE